jgi:hypothetical protein
MDGTTRRPLLKMAAGGAALAAVGTTARLTLHPDDDDDSSPEAGALELSTHAGTDVASLHLPLGDDLLPAVGSKRWESRRLPTSTHSLVAFTWGAGRSGPVAHIRSRSAGNWGAWVRVPDLHDVPEAVAGDDAAIDGTDLVWIGRADGVQIRVEGRRPDDLSLVLLYPERRPGDPLLGQLSARIVDRRAGDDTARAPQPRLVTREEWGADESLRDGRPSYIHTIKQVHVHHTVNSNTYARDDVPALIRGMYAYHTQTLGWSDIGYNFLVDRFGRAFVGRAGGPAKLVRGAHTLGFNAESTGVSAIGNYETVRPTDRMLDAIAAIAAWKLDPFNRNPRGEIRVESEGSDKYATGRTVKLPVIDGHRDTNDTACPGQHLYEALPKIRRRAARILANATADTIVIDEPATITGSPRLGELLAIQPGAYRPGDASVTYHWLRGERPIRGARDRRYRVRPRDVGHKLTCQVTLVRTGLDPVTQRPPAVGPVTAEPTLDVNTSVRRRVARVEITVAAPSGVRPHPTGSITVRVGDRTKTVQLEGGIAVARFGAHRRLAPGTYPVRVAYGGDAAFTKVTREGAVTVS